MKTAFFIDGKTVSWPVARLEVPAEGEMWVFESMKSYGGKIFRLSAHLDRLFESAKTIGLRLPKTREIIAAEIKKCLKGFENGDYFLRFWADSRHTCLAITMRKRPQSIYREGVCLETSSIRRNHINSEPPGAKTSAFLNGVLAVQGLADDRFDRIFLDQNGYVAEGTIWNVFIAKKGILYTPGSGILDGVTRRFVIECAQKERLPVIETCLTRHDFWNSDEAFLTNTSGEIVPIRSLDGRTIGREIPGALTKKLIKRFNHERIKELNRQ